MRATAPRGPEWSPQPAAKKPSGVRPDYGVKGPSAARGGAPPRGGTVGKIGRPISSSQREHGATDLDAVRPSPKLLETAANTPPPSCRLAVDESAGKPDGAARPRPSSAPPTRAASGPRAGLAARNLFSGCYVAWTQRSS